MLDLCYEVLEQLKEDIENNNFIENQYIDTWGYEDEYSHDEIEENRDKFIELANQYFTENHLNYLMREVVENTMVCDKQTGEILRRE